MEKIGKLSLIFSLIITLSLVIAGFVMPADALLKITGEQLPYALLMLFPVCSFLISAFLAIVVYVIVKKPGVEHEKSNASPLFKSFFFIWLILSVGVAISGLVLFDHNAANIHAAFTENTLLAALVWACALISSVFVWATCNTWKNNKMISSVLGVITAIILIGSFLVVGYSYFVNSQAHNDVFSNQYEDDYYTEETSYNDGETPQSENPVNSENNNNKTAGNDYDKAYRFLNYRLDFQHSSGAIDLIRNWRGYSLNAKGEWGNEKYDAASKVFENPSDFSSSFGSFFSVYENSRHNNEELTKLSNYYIDNASSKISKNTYKKSGTRECVKALLLVHDDIYAKENHDAILEEMYQIMTTSAPDEHIDDIVVSYRYPQLRKYMTDNALKKIKLTGKNTTEWQNNLFAAWAYSFWARRYHDNVAETSHKILKRIDNFYK